MKKIIISLAIIAAAGAIAIGATTAFFNDTETSSGNTFTAGTIDLQIDSQATYNGVSVPEATWALKDLNPTSDKFFNFSDIKPGDEGENTISLHIFDNNAYGCFYVSPLANNDNGCNEPESAVDTTCGDPGPGEGELAQNVNFFAWADDGDNVWEVNEAPLFADPYYGPASDVLNGQTYPLGLLSGAETHYIGLQWCAGTMTVDTQNYTVTCDGSLMGNASQSDSFSGSVAFYVEQERNNNEFECPENPFFPS